MSVINTTLPCFQPELFLAVVGRRAESADAQGKRIRGRVEQLLRHPELLVFHFQVPHSGELARSLKPKARASMGAA
jgi:hypothetical protein